MVPFTKAAHAQTWICVIPQTEAHWVHVLCAAASVNRGLQGFSVMQAKAQAVTAQLAETTLELDRLRIQQRELGKLLGQAQTRSIPLPGQVVTTTKSSYKGIAYLQALLAVCRLLPRPLYSDGCST